MLLLKPMKCKALISTSRNVARLYKQLKSCSLGIDSSGGGEPRLVAINIRFSSAAAASHKGKSSTTVISAEKIKVLSSLPSKPRDFVLELTKPDGAKHRLCYIFIKVDAVEKLSREWQSFLNVKHVEPSVVRYQTQVSHSHWENVSDENNSKCLEMRSKNIVVIDICSEVYHTIDLAGNFLSKMTISRPELIQRLNLSQNSLKSVPVSLTLMMPNLVHLDLSQNLLQTIPWSIVQLRNLRVVNLSQNQLQWLPVVIFELKLQELDVSHNCFGEEFDLMP